MRKDITFEELDSERVELLPSKETLASGNFFHSWIGVQASNSSWALTAGSAFSHTASQAVQQITVTG